LKERRITMSKTNMGLVAYAKAQLGHPYWYGCFGQISTKQLYKVKKKQYPKYYTWALPNNQLGTRVYDCVGLIKGYLWSSSITAKPKYNAKQDVSANGMHAVCKKHGAMNDMPNVAGTLVFKNGHVGVYIGGGEVIEAKGHAWGVVKTKLASGGWTGWGWCPWIEYETEDNGTLPRPKYFKKYDGSSVSIVDALAFIGAPYSFSYRKKIAKVNKIKAYVGLPKQNIKMLNLLKRGKLIKP
jgi:hypothetical protein